MKPAKLMLSLVFAAALCVLGVRGQLHQNDPAAEHVQVFERSASPESNHKLSSVLSIVHASIPTEILSAMVSSATCPGDAYLEECYEALPDEVKDLLPVLYPKEINDDETASKCSTLYATSTELDTVWVTESLSPVATEKAVVHFSSTNDGEPTSTTTSILYSTTTITKTVTVSLVHSSSAAVSAHITGMFPVFTGPWFNTTSSPVTTMLNGTAHSTHTSTITGTATSSSAANATESSGPLPPFFNKGHTTSKYNRVVIITLTMLGYFFLE